jgi:L-fucose isomerase-like protein
MDSGNNSNTSSQQGAQSPWRGSVAVLLPYWDFWESSVPWDFRADRIQLLNEAIALMSETCDVTVCEVLHDAESARALSATLGSVDAIVVIASMAAPSATTVAAIAPHPRTPVLVWALSRHHTQPIDFSHTDVTTGGSSVGAPMVTSALARANHPFSVVATSLEAPEPALRAVRQTVAAGRLLRRPVLRIGPPIPGYTTVVPPDNSPTWFPTVDVPAATFADLARSAMPDDVAHLVTEIREEYEVNAGVTPLAIERAAQAELALRALVDASQAAAGTINCHVDEIRANPDFGIAPCFALGRLTSSGIPFTCTGDVLTAVAMGVVKNLGHPALYHEVEALDFARNEVILANTGEHDLGLCAAKAELVPNKWFEHDEIVSPCTVFSIASGPGTLVAYVMAPHPRFVVAEGMFTGRQSPESGTPNAGFRFHEEPVARAWERWAQAGVTHHSVATNAHIADDVRAIANVLSLEFVQIS